VAGSCMTTMTMARQQVVYQNIVFLYGKKIHTCKPTFGRRGKVLYETKGVPSRSNVWRFCYQGGSFILIVSSRGRNRFNFRYTKRMHRTGYSSSGVDIIIIYIPVELIVTI